MKVFGDVFRHDMSLIAVRIFRLTFSDARQNSVGFTVSPLFFDMKMRMCLYPWMASRFSLGLFGS